MKKLTLFFVFILVCTALFGCNSNSGKVNTDMNLVGAWQVDGEDRAEYYIFTEDSKVKIVRGSVSFEGEASFTVDKLGNHTYLSNFYYMSGELSYSFNGDTVTFDDGAGTTLTLRKAEYTAPDLKTYDDFNADNPLVGTWANEEYCDSYTFNPDGTASYYMEVAELEYVSRIDYTYTVKDGTILLSYDAGDGIQETAEEYEISGDILNILSVGEYTRQ